MKLSAIVLAFRSYFRLPVNTTGYVGTVGATPAGLAADNVGMWGLFGYLSNINVTSALNLFIYAIATATTLTLSAVSPGAGISSPYHGGIIDISGSPGGAVGITTDTAANIITKGFGPNIPKNGMFGYLLGWMNDGTGQTITLTGGSGVTINGNNTIATNTIRWFYVNVNANANTVAMVNVGTQNL